MDVPPHTSVALMGSSGVGKSTLLRTFGRFNELRPSFWAHGEVLLEGRELFREMSLEEAQSKIVLFQQKARLFTVSVLDNAVAGVWDGSAISRAEKIRLAEEVLGRWGLVEAIADQWNEPVTKLSIGNQRRLLLARLLRDNVKCLLLDEPLRDLNDEEREQMVLLLRSVRARVSLIFVTHNLLEARDLSDSVVLLADGTVVEQTDTKTFFEQSPATELGRRFRESGNCWTASSLLDEESDSCGADGNAQKPEQLPSWRPTAAEATPQPGGFHWVLRGLLGGMQMPGLLRETDSDLRGAAALGVQHLVSLTELAFSSEAAGRFGISVRHFPIEDMGVPTITGAYELTGWVQEVLARREPVALHCRAGLGRTGTMLACVLVRGGMRGLSAIETVRKVNPLYIQSEVQFAFVNAFGEFCAKSALSA